MPAATTPTPLDLDEIQARCEAATPGPWVVDRSGGVDDPEHCTESGCRGYHVWPAADAEEHTERATAYTPDDAIFVAHAREDVPALVARVRELEAMIETLLPWAFVGAAEMADGTPDGSGQDRRPGASNTLDRILSGEFGPFRAELA